MSDELLTNIINKLKARVDELNAYITKNKEWGLNSYSAGYSEAMEDAIYIISEMNDNQNE